jgi:hypothetical protein
MRSIARWRRDCRSTIFWCASHTDEDECDCRKPLPGMLLEAARQASTSIWRRVSWSATAGATSRPVIMLVAGLFLSITAIRRDLQTVCPTCAWSHSAKRLTGSSVPRPKERIPHEVCVRPASANLRGRGRQSQHSELYRQPYIKGFTTNPTLMRAMESPTTSGFALDLLATIHDRPISFEVFADEEGEMEEQARTLQPGARTCSSRFR